MALLGAFSAAVLLGSGCQNQEAGAGSPVASASPTSTVFSGQSLPSTIDSLTGTPYYTNSSKLAEIAKLDGAPFLLIAPQDPSKALLVLELEAKPSELAERPSQLGNFSGSTESIEAPELIKFVKDDTGLDLQQDNGKVTVLKLTNTTATSDSTPSAPNSPSGAES